MEKNHLGSIGYLFQFACVISGVITESLGRKLSMQLVNIPFALGWFMLYRADEVWEIFAGFGILGFGIGMMESSIVTYGWLILCHIENIFEINLYRCSLILYATEWTTAV